MHIPRLAASVLSATLVTAAVAVGSASAAPAPAVPKEIMELLNTGSATMRDTPQPGVVGRNGVATMSATVSATWSSAKLGPDLYSTQFRPTVHWSARDRSNAEVRGQNCQIEVSFPKTTIATYRTASCQSYRSFGTTYRTPGSYSIVVVDKVSGKSTSRSFTIR